MNYASGKPAITIISMRDLAAIEQHNFFKWVNDYTCSGALEVVTAAAFYINLASGIPYYVTSIDMEVLTANKDCYFELGTTDAPAGAGTFTPRSPAYYLDRGAASTAGTFQERFWTIPIDMRYDVATCRSITMRLDGMDASTHVLFGMKGYWID